MFVIKYVSGLLLVLKGTMDCLTTVVGTFFFGARELNPLIAGLVNSNLLTFVVVKLMVTVYVGVIFVLAEKILLGSANKVNRLFKIAHKILRVSYVSIVLFLVIVVINNIIVIINTSL